MPIDEIILGVILVALFSLIYSFLDKKYEWARMPGLYRDVFWQNYIVNLAVTGTVYFIGAAIVANF